MTIPLAVAPSQLTPGLYLVVNLLAGASSAGTGQLRVALMSPKTTAGDLTDDTEVRAGGGPDTASTAFGPGSLGHLAAKLLYAKFPAAVVDFIAPASGAGLATLNVTLSGVPTGNNTVRFDIMGRVFDIAWLVGESADDVKVKVIAKILELTQDIYVTAVTGGVGIVTINGKDPGNAGNDVLVKATLVNAATGSEAVAGAAVPTNLAGGTTDPDFTTALSNLEGREYPVILPCLSNTDVANIAATNNLKRVVTHIDSLNTGLRAKLQQVVAGFTGTLAQATATTVDSESLGNSNDGELVLATAGRGLPSELGGREVGDWLAFYSIDPAANRIGNEMDGYIGAEDTIAETPTLSESETALGNGVSIISYTDGGAPFMVRPITTHSKDSAGGQDLRLLDVQNVVATYVVSRRLRSSLPAEFPNAKVVKDTPEGEEPPPRGVIEERDIKGFVISELRAEQDRGIITRASLDAAIADDTLIVQVNEQDATQVDIVTPFKIVPPLAKTGLVVQRQPN